ncbi:MAG TPA: hypothetical protein VLF61_00575 [Rhabdochlamydiaceae bacterium]|nr:hypothetical protein [Rhabdochlamydiaceae bacterium]
MNLLKLIKTILIFSLLFFLVERFCRLQTDGFSIAKIVPHGPLNSQEAPIPLHILEVLDQPYTFLGSGVQCYTFLSEDRQSVIKFFKHYHLFPGNNILKKIPVPHFLDLFKQQLLTAREERLKKIFRSCQIAYDQLEEETGTFFLHFNKSESAKITLIDKLGIQHALDLGEMEFILQKKAEPLEARFKQAKDKQAIEASLDALRKLHSACTQKGFKNKDGKIRNYAFIGEKAVMIDIGSLKKRKQLTTALVEKEQKRFEEKMERWRKTVENSL